MKIKVASYDFAGKQDEVYAFARQLPESHLQLLPVVQTEKHPFFKKITVKISIQSRQSYFAKRKLATRAWRDVDGELDATN